jgi:hypothetical protein
MTSQRATEAEGTANSIANAHRNDTGIFGLLIKPPLGIECSQLPWSAFRYVGAS